MFINKLQINRLKRTFPSSDIITTEDLYSFYQGLENSIPRSTVNWRVYEMVQKGILKRVGTGRFEWGNKTEFYPTISKEVKELSTKIKKQYPFINYCIWDSAMIKPFHQHMPGVVFILVDVEKDATEPIFNFLKEEHKSTYLKPDVGMIDNYIMQNENSVIVRQLITEAPTQISDEVPTLTIEKMLVDIFSDNEFEYLQGHELLLIFKNIFENFTVNQSKLTRYASRKGKRKKIINFLEYNHFTQPISS